MRITEQARELQQSALIIDGHLDTLWERDYRGIALDMSERDETMQADVPRLLEAGFAAVNLNCALGDHTEVMRLLDGALRMVETHSDLLTIAERTEDILGARAAGKLAFVLQIESCRALGGEIGTLELLHRAGLRVVNLTHGEAQPCQALPTPGGYCSAGDRATAATWPGLTEFGREVIAECGRLRMVVDLSHTYDACFYEAIALAQAPVIFSHGCVFSECPHRRNLTDEQLQALAACGGVLGMTFYPPFIDRDEPSLGRLLDHFDHAIDLVGPDHVGIGSDFDGMDGEAPIPSGLDEFGELIQGLLDRGHDEEVVRKVLGGNFLRVYRAVLG